KAKYDYISNSKYEVDLPYRVKVTANGKASLLDVRTGKLMMPLLFESVTHSTNPFLPKNLMIVENDDKYGVYNTDTKQLLVPLNYSYISAYHHLFYIEREEKKGVMTFEGKMLVSPIYNRINTL